MLMPKKDPRIDEYIANAKPFAKPVLKHLRKLIHQAIPEVTETIKWGFASFDYKGPLCSFASFKEHCVFGFWKYQLIKDKYNVLQERSNKGGEAMGNLGRINIIDDLPEDDVMIDLLLQAKQLNDLGIKLPARKKADESEKKELVIPKELIAALNKNKKAKALFEKFAYSHKKEYAMWVAEAKTETTRDKRIAQAVEWIAEGKGRNWKYERKK
jgi:uncharacterized protein YdeI (YjbR/CyaY-like superfamily)